MGRSIRSIKNNPPIKNDENTENYSKYSSFDKLKNKSKNKPLKKFNSKIFIWSLIALTLIAILISTGFFQPKPNDFVENENLSENPLVQSNGEPVSIVLYTSPSCGCCSIYADYLTKNDFDVFIKRVNNLNEIKEQNNVPESQWSCHTIIMGDYFTEGHIPLSVVFKLLREKPEIDGIALPGMPLGTPGMGADNPGMGGSKNEDWVVSSVVNGQVISVFATV